MCGLDLRYNVCYNYNTGKNKCILVAIVIKKLQNKRKKWLDRRSRKIAHKKSKSKQTKRCKGYREYGFNHSNEISNIKNKKRKRQNNEINFVAPVKFSLENNTAETMEFFDKIMSTKNNKRIGTVFNIDSSNVEDVSVDALMYLIAIINDVKYNSIFRYTFCGNFPKSDNAMRIYKESGFMDFVQSNCNMVIPKSNSIRIQRGDNNDPITAKQVCQFVQQNCFLNKIDTMPLYNILVEMMGNTRQHAYEKGMYDKAKCWYLYAEEEQDNIKFVFLDTGLGIPATIQKKWTEKIPIINKDSEFIKSALNGDFRTQTKMPNRGKGLPQISDSFKSGLLRDVFVCSGKGICRLNNTNNYSTNEMKYKLSGTLFSWIIQKGRR